MITLQYRKWGEAGLSGRIENKMESCKRSERCEMDHETLDGAIPQVFVSSQSPAALLLSSLQSTIAEKNAQYDRGRGRGKSGGFWTLGNCCLLIFQELPYRCNIAHFNRANKCTVCTVTVCTCISSIYIYKYMHISKGQTSECTVYPVYPVHTSINALQQPTSSVDDWIRVCASIYPS